MKKGILTACLALLCMGDGYAGGFQQNLQGIRQMAMGGTGTALTWNADIIFYNPAGMAHLDIWQTSVSALAVMPGVQYTQGNYSASSKEQILTPFNVYVGGPIGGKKAKGKIAVGVGIYTPFGGGLKWDDNWQGRYINRETALQTIFAQPTVSYKFSEKFSFGVGYVVGYGTVKLRQALPVQDINGNDGSRELTGTTWGRGFNAGIKYTVNRTIQVGLSYRSQVNMYTDKGDAKFNVAPALADSFPDTKFRTELPLPQVATFGIGYRPFNKLTLQADVNFTGWSSYDSLQFDFAHNTQQLQDISAPRKYKNTFTYRFGLNYAFNPKIAVMLGAVWDPSPVRDDFVSPDMPDADRMVGTGGIAYRPFNKITITAAVEYVTTKPRNGNYAYENFSGTYQVKAITPGIGISVDL